MEALALRLSQLDPGAGDAIRVVMFYDTLMRRRVDLPGLARSSAGFAECVVGIRLFGTGRVLRVGPDGRETRLPESPASMASPVVLDGEEIGAVWLERTGTPSPFDALVLDRLALAVTAVTERYGPASTTMADPALVELVISADSDEAAQNRALRLMGFAAGTPLRAVAVRSEVPLDHVGRSICPRGLVKTAVLNEASVILAVTVDADRFPAGVQAGIGAADESPARSWRQARTALRFAAPREPVVRYEALGALALLAEIPEDAVRDNPDVLAIARLAACQEELDTLDAYCATGSQRRAADLLHLHHSSVARRLEQIEKTLGLELADPAGLVRARLALTAWRLLAR